MGRNERNDKRERGNEPGPVRAAARRTPSQVGSNAPGRVTLVRGRHTWRFEFGDGDRAALLTALDELAARSECPFDAFDAALVGHEACHGRASGGDLKEAA